MNQRERQQQLQNSRQVNSKPDPRVVTPVAKPTRSSKMISEEALPGIDTKTVSYNNLSNLPTTFPPSVHTQDWDTITDTPTTMAGYGITDYIRVSQIEIDFGLTPIDEQTFTIINALITPTTNIIAQIAYVAPTNKELDELEFDSFDFRCVAGTGNFTLYARSLEGYVAEKFKINYLY